MMLLNLGEASRDEMLGSLGAGGMADVFLVRRRRPGGFEKFLALKRIRRCLDDAMHAAMMQDEARIVALLQHPNIVQVVDSGRDEDGLWFLMEYVHGRSVSAVIQRALDHHIRIPLASILYIGANIARALHYAHQGETSRGQLRVVHRDVSPSNVLVGFDGVVKLADFGVARAEYRRAETETGLFKGKYGYASPEQIRGDELDGSSDLFALGIVMYEMLARERLFLGTTPTETAKAVLEQPIPTTLESVPGTPAELDRIIGRMLARDRKERYACGADVAHDLEVLALGLGESATRESMAAFMSSIFAAEEIALVCPEPSTVADKRKPGSSSSNTSLSSATTGVVPRRHRRSLLPWGFAVVAILAVAAIAGRSSGSARPPSSPSSRSTPSTHVSTDREPIAQPVAAPAVEQASGSNDDREPVRPEVKQRTREKPRRPKPPPATTSTQPSTAAGSDATEAPRERLLNLKW